jgi:hypothetical protein
VKYKKDSELYLKMYSELLKWINECPVCHSKGYKPEMPEHMDKKALLLHIINYQRRYNESMGIKFL